MTDLEKQIIEKVKEMATLSARETTIVLTAIQETKKQYASKLDEIEHYYAYPADKEKPVITIDLQQAKDKILNS
jgi:flagellar biosynthesis chaperone FliJ